MFQVAFHVGWAGHGGGGGPEATLTATTAAKRMAILGRRWMDTARRLSSAHRSTCQHRGQQRESMRRENCTRTVRLQYCT
jgi:hypothetical protein